MRLWYFQASQPNFGDELNSWLWPKLLADHLDSDSDELFLAIGSILFRHFDPRQRKIVFGSGYGALNAPPDVHDGSWDVRFVRGPNTARALCLPASSAIADPAVLMNQHAPALGPGSGAAGFMPHWESMGRGRWERACHLAGVRLIDPRQPVDNILRQLTTCRVVIAEAMHGAIVADALRIPWVAVLPIDHRQRFKWSDWAGSLDIDLRPHGLRPSSWDEAHLLMPNFRPGRGAVRLLRAAPAGPWLQDRLTERAAARLRSSRAQSRASAATRCWTRP